MSSILTNLPQLTAATNSDWLYIVDVSDTTDNPAGSSKKILRGDLYTQITGFTYLDNTITLSLSDNSTYAVTINTMTGLTINGDIVITGQTTTGSISATTYYNLPLDVYTTGGTYDTGTLTFTNNSGGTYNVTGLVTGDTYWTSGSTGNFSIKVKNDSGLDARGDYSLAEGKNTLSTGLASHAEGVNTTANGDGSHAEGSSSYAGGNYSHAEGSYTYTSGLSSHAEGRYTMAHGDYSHTEGDTTIAGWRAFAVDSVINGIITLSPSYGNITSGFTGTQVILDHTIRTYHTVTFSSTTNTEILLDDITINTGSFVADLSDLYMLEADINMGHNSHSEGTATKAIGENSHAEGENTKSIGPASHAEGFLTTASGHASHAEGGVTTASGDGSHAEGAGTTASGYHSHAEGYGTIASGVDSHAEGNETVASNDSSHAEGFLTTASGQHSHAEGYGTIASGTSSHAEGDSTIAGGDYSHAEGKITKTIGDYSHAEGNHTKAYGGRSHAEGNYTQTGYKGFRIDSVVNGLVTLESVYGDVRSEFTGNKVILEYGEYQILTYNTVTFSSATNTQILLDDVSINNGYNIGDLDKLNSQYSDDHTGGENAHAEGVYTKAIGATSHAEGANTIAIGVVSHTEGENTQAIGRGSHAGGNNSTASGETSFIHSYESIVLGDRSVVLGGQGITGSTDDTVYVPYFNIQSATTDNILTEVLVIDINGDVKKRSVNTIGFTGGTVSGATIFTGGLSANTFSATTYYNLPLDVYTTGGTYFNGTLTFTNNSGGAFNVTGLVTGDTYWTSGSTGNFSIKAKNNSGLDATGDYAVAEGYNTTASGTASHAEGYNTTASGGDSHAEGVNTLASGDYSHAEGDATIANGLRSHAEGWFTTASGGASHAEGTQTKAGWKGFTIDSVVDGLITLNSSYGDVTSEFFSNQVIVDNNLYLYVALTFSSTTNTQILLDDITVNSGQYVSDIENIDSQYANNFLGNSTHAEGVETKSLGNNSHAEGIYSVATGENSHAQGYGTTASGWASHSEGAATLASGFNAHAEGNSTTASGDYSHAEGSSTKASGFNSHSEGNSTIASGDNSHAEGNITTASGNTSHAEGSGTIAGGNNSHAEGQNTTSTGDNSHAEGGTTQAIGTFSHAEGNNTIASGESSHSEGQGTLAGGNRSHAGGYYSIASGETSFIHSYESIVLGNRSVVLGGQSITGMADDTVYVPYLNVQSTITDNTLTEILVIDTNGDVKKRTVSSVDTYTTGFIFDVSNYDLTIQQNNDQPDLIVNLGILSSDVTITGGTYNPTTGIAEFTNNTGGTFSVSGFITGMTDTYVTGFTYSNNTLTIKQNAGQPDLSVNIDTLTGLTINGNLTVTGQTTTNSLSANTITASTITATNYENLPFTDNETVEIFLSGGTEYLRVKDIVSAPSGGTRTFLGNVIVNNGFTASTISATTYYNLPVTIDTYTTGGTYNNTTGIATFTNNTGGTFNVSGFYTGATDTYTTGYTYNNNTFTIKRNNGLSDLSVNVNTMTGLTINGDLIVTGRTTSTSISATTITADTITATNYENLPFTDNQTLELFISGGTEYARLKDNISAPSGGTRTFQGDIVVNGGFTANTISATTYYNLPVAIDTYTTGFTFNTSNYDLTIKRNNSQPDLTVNLGILSSDVTITGGTYNPTTGSATFTNNTGGTFSVSGFLTGMTDTYVTGFTYSNNRITIKQNAGQPDLTVDINTLTGLTINGNLTVTGLTTSNEISANTITATTITATNYENLPFTDNQTIEGFVSGDTTYVRLKEVVSAPSGGTRTFLGNVIVNSGFTASTISATTYYNLPTTIDTYTTGGTYNNSTGIATFTNNTGGTFNVTGFYTGSTDNYTTGYTYSNNTFTIKRNNNLPDLSVNVNTMTGLTINGNINVTGQTTTGSISATTYYNLPLDVFTTGGTYSNGTLTFTNNSGGTFNVTGLITGTTDSYTTGFTYSNNTFTLSRNNGLPNLTATINSLTGLTINGDLTVTGQTITNSLSASTITATTVTADNYENLPFTDNQTVEIFLSGGTEYLRVKDTISAPSGGTRTFQGNVVVNNGFTANTISATTYYNLPTTVDTFTTGFTFNTSNYDLTIKRNNSQPDLTVNLGILSSDVTITGGTYNSTTGIATFTNNTGGTFNVTGFLTGMTDTYVTGFTYNNNTLTIKQTAGQPDLLVDINTLTGLTINGDITITGQTTTNSLSATTISATTYYNLPQDIFTTGGTYNNTTGIATFTNNSGGTFNVTGFLTGATDSYTTGYTYSDNTFTLKRNNNLPDLSVSVNTMTGLTINGDLIVTGQTTSGSVSATTMTATTITADNYENLPFTDNETLELFISGGTEYARLKETISAPSGGTRTFQGNVIVNSGFTASTISATTYYNLPTTIDTFTTGGTYNNTTGIATFTNNTGGTFNVSGFYTGATDSYTTGFTFNSSNYDLTIKRNNSLPDLTVNLGILSSDVTITGGTYNPTTGIAIFTNNTGGTFSVSGFLTGMTDTYVSGFTYSNNNLTIKQTAGQPDLLVNINTLTGLTINGNLTVTGLTTSNAISANTITATTITATDYQNLPFTDNQTIEGFVSGDTTYVRLKEVVSAPSGGTRTFQGNVVVSSGFTANTISATTYYNLPTTIDTFTTGFTYNNNTFTLSRNNGLPNLTATINTLTGLTVNGNLTVTGQTISTSLSATTYYNLPLDVYTTGGTYNTSTGVATFTNNTGGTFNVTGFTNPISMSVDYIDFNTAYTGQTLPAGRIQWDDGNGTLVVGLKGGTSNMEIGLENMALCYNDELTTLTAGTIVYVSGSQGNRPAIKRAIATSDGYSVTTLGIVSESITPGTEGFVTTFGMVNNLNTIGYSGGTPIWLSPTVSGTFTAVKPKAPEHIVLLGYVVRVHASVGSVFVHISNGWEIDELHDVRLNGRVPGDLLTYSGYNGSNVWVNSKTLNGSYTITGDTNIGGGLTASTISASTVSGNTGIYGTLSVTTVSATTYQNLPKVGFSPINVGVCDTAPTAASTQYYYQTVGEVTTTLSKVKLWGFSGSDLVLFGIYRGSLSGTMTLIGQARGTCGLGSNELTLTAETGQNLTITAGEDLVVGYYPDGTSWRTIYDVGISDISFGITNTNNITTMPATPTGTATGIRFACTLY